MNQSSVYPIVSRELAHALSDDPVLIEGMKVLFDVKVALYPVSLAPPRDDPKRDRNGR